MSSRPHRGPYCRRWTFSASLLTDHQVEHVRNMDVPYMCMSVKEDGGLFDVSGLVLFERAYGNRKLDNLCDFLTWEKMHGFTMQAVSRVLCLGKVFEKGILKKKDRRFRPCTEEEALTPVNSPV